jgi:hypothetical protein
MFSESAAARSGALRPLDRSGCVAARHQHPGVPGARGRRQIAELRDMGPDLQAVRLAADVRLLQSERQSTSHVPRSWRGNPPIGVCIRTLQGRNPLAARGDKDLRRDVGYPLSSESKVPDSLSAITNAGEPARPTPAPREKRDPWLPRSLGSLFLSLPDPALADASRNGRRGIGSASCSAGLRRS